MSSLLMVICLGLLVVAVVVCMLLFVELFVLSACARSVRVRVIMLFLI